MWVNQFSVASLRTPNKRPGTGLRRRRYCLIPASPPQLLAVAAPHSAPLLAPFVSWPPRRCRSHQQNQLPGATGRVHMIGLLPCACGGGHLSLGATAASWAESGFSCNVRSRSLFQGRPPVPLRRRSWSRAVVPNSRLFPTGRLDVTFLIKPSLPWSPSPLLIPGYRPQTQVETEAAEYLIPAPPRGHAKAGGALMKSLLCRWSAISSGERDRSSRKINAVPPPSERAPKSIFHPASRQRVLIFQLVRLRLDIWDEA